ncbi:hypothetical protein IE81DRAFT_320574 [Ceraceosorus guamensis]|uniref:Uncharacterized protein n=1 Tax=Ceraceosorus guamensis TaxID=1522189 RepID=A0A316W503_9BASI|nr:hypothetical protein IE81DRAFT_320574 [Ceraceosorus guamensis]PWN44980.1 hypothetical protein IE81DRAFT_320574 [Ceraceosorus guamensis]
MQGAIASSSQVTLLASDVASSHHHIRKAERTPLRQRKSPRSMSWSAIVLACLAAVVLSAQPSSAQFQNVTSLAGTWASGSGNVLTGLEFFNPIAKKFTVPRTSGIAYSFTNDGFFETSTYTYTSNSANNRCFRAALTWQHGSYTFNPNGSISLTPFAPDGYVQVMDPCAGTSVAQYQYKQFELIPQWYNYLDPKPGFLPEGQTAYGMKMFNDGGGGEAGAPKPIMWLVRRPPNMLPTQQLYQEVIM